MAISYKFKKFLEENRPPKKNCNVTVNKTVKNLFFHRKEVVQLTLEVSWYIKEIRANKVVFRPVVSSHELVSRERLDSLQEKEGEVVITTPERVVVLPRAPWDYSQAWSPMGDARLEEETVTCFQSEIKGYIQPFIDQLQAL